MPGEKVKVTLPEGTAGGWSGRGCQQEPVRCGPGRKTQICRQDGQAGHRGGLGTQSRAVDSRGLRRSPRFYTVARSSLEALKQRCRILPCSIPRSRPGEVRGLRGVQLRGS